MTALLFIGETWRGSSARSLREALEAQGAITDDIGEDHYLPKAQSVVIRVANRLLAPLYRRELASEVLRRVAVVRPRVVVVYKGGLVEPRLIDALKDRKISVVNVYPDHSPNVYGDHLTHALGLYDLVISTKPYHPAHWQTTYGYRNRCVCVPHGYDPAVHAWPAPPAVDQQDIDVVLAATWRPQYEAVMLALAAELRGDAAISVALAGPGWEARRDRFPAHWRFPGPLFGRAYGEFLRRGRIVVAPVHTDVVVDGRVQPGDQDTTRTYELAAMGTFFAHRRTPYVETVYREGQECVFWDDAADLARLIHDYLPRAAERQAIAAAGQRRAVDAYSIPGRAGQVLAHIRALVEEPGT